MCNVGKPPVQRRWLYVSGAVFSALGVIVISPLTWSSGGGTLLWEGRVAAEEGSGGSGNILADVIGALLTQVINQSSDHAHSVAERANAQFAVKDRGLLYGPYSPKYGTE
jgi:hypothetical protein